MQLDIRVGSLYNFLGPVSISIRCLIVRSHKVSKSRDLYLEYVRSLWNLSGILAALPISWLRDFVGYYDKMSYRILKWGPGSRLLYSIKKMTTSPFKCYVSILKCLVREKLWCIQNEARSSPNVNMELSHFDLKISSITMIQNPYKNICLWNLHRDQNFRNMIQDLIE